MSTRIYRSMLFMPADDDKKVWKGAKSEAGAIILDLEDAIPIDRKDGARRRAVQLLEEIRQLGRSVFVRINSPGDRANDSLWVSDLVETARSQPSGFVVPKVESEDELLRVDAACTQIEKELGITKGRFSLWALIESAKGLIQVESIAASTNRLGGLIFGAEDYAASVGATRTDSEDEVLYARSRVVCAAAANDLQAVDTVFLDFRNESGLTKVCDRVKKLGFTGKLAIHPAQIDAIEESFRPTPDEIQFARDLLDAFHNQEGAEAGVISFRGKMIDRPILEQARRILENS